VNDREKFHKLFTKAESEKIGIDVLKEPWTKSNSHVSHWEYQTSYVTICTEGITEHFLTVVLAHEIGHITVTRKGLNIGTWFENPLVHELYAWKVALEDERIEENPELFELAQWQLNRYLFASCRALNDTTDTDAQTEEINRLINSLSSHVQKRTQTFI